MQLGLLQCQIAFFSVAQTVPEAARNLNPALFVVCLMIVSENYVKCQTNLVGWPLPTKVIV